MSNRMSYRELEEAYKRQRETIKGLCKIGIVLLELIEKRDIKLDDLRSIISSLRSILI